MACIVAGFPSNIAALQFEWAWHNSHLTRHITPTERISFATTRTKTSKSGKTSRRPGRPRTSMMDKLSNLHLLLRAPYFSKWPLEVRFFSQDVYRSWQTWCERVDTHLPAAIEVQFDPAQTPSHDDQEEFTSAQPVLRMTKAELIGKGGVHGVDPTYARLRNVFEKSQFLLDEDDDHRCSACRDSIDLRRDLFVLCHTNGCQGISHINCLADRSLKEERSDSMVPGKGSCPACNQKHAWTELMQQVTLRTRGMKEVQKLLKKKGKSTAVAAAEILESESEEEAEEKEALTAQDVVDEDFGGDHEDEEDEDDDNASVASTASVFSPNSKARAGTKQTDHQVRLEIVIEDSEDER
ncbi:hypothetical protein EDD37DRAFT_660432 [Exophiala viscosa]|nr:hypothetical protein EDD37DRAFT_660432 [Exophiala viscosa]